MNNTGFFLTLVRGTMLGIPLGIPLGITLSILLSMSAMVKADIQDMPSSDDVAPIVSSATGPARKDTLLVKRFALEGVIDRPAAGITLEGLLQHTQELHNRLGVQLTVLDIHHIADQLTQIYRQAGYPFSRVMVPAQEILTGVVRLQVIEATVDSVHVRGGDGYDQAQFTSMFSSVIGEVVNTQQIEALVRRVNGFPGLSTFSYFSKGPRPNTTRININIQQEERWSLLTKLDNYGVDTTGEYRGLASLTLNNPFGVADQLSLGILQSVNAEEEENTTYGSIQYRAPLFHSGFSLALLASNNQFDIGQDFSSLGLQGEASIARGELRYQWYPSRSLNSTFTAYGDSKRSELLSELNTDVLDKEETSQGGGVRWTLNYRGEGSPLQQKLFLDVYGGQYDIEYGEDAALPTESDGFVKSQLRYQLRWDWIAAFSQVQWDVRLQHTDVALPSIEQMSASGPYGVRGLESGFYSADRGAITSLQWRFMNPSWSFSRMLVPFIFYDAALLERIDVQNEQLTATGAGVGVDYRFALTDTLRVFGRVTYGATDTIEQRNVDTDETNMTIDPQQQHRVYGEINVQF